MVENLQGQTLKNASIGVMVTTVAYFIPVLHIIAPIFGGLVAGYLQKEGAMGGLKAGSAKGALVIIPAFPIALLAGAILAEMPIIGGLLAGSTVIVAVIIVAHSMAFGAFGGLFGGMMAGTGRRRPAGSGQAEESQNLR